MENIIKKAIEGGYNLDTVFGVAKAQANFDMTKYPAIQSKIVLDPLFWQALGKACGWDTRIYYTEKENATRDFWYLEKAIRFHEINLTEGWEKAIEYLENITN